VVLNVNASGSPAYILYAEFQYIQSRHDWTIVGTSGWQPYASSHTNFPWKLKPGAGAHFILAWVADYNGHVSLKPGKAVINYNPSLAHVVQNEIKIYRYKLQAGDSYLLRLTSVTGDADIYIFGPGGTFIASSESENLMEDIYLTVPANGTYQIEVEGFTSAYYKLDTVPVNTVPSLPTRSDRSINLPVARGRDTPLSDGNPEDDIGLPDVPTSSFVIYLPMIIR
jgi:hypothetical protein